MANLACYDPPTVVFIVLDCIAKSLYLSRAVSNDGHTSSYPTESKVAARALLLFRLSTPYLWLLTWYSNELATFHSSDQERSRKSASTSNSCALSTPPTARLLPG